MRGGDEMAHILLVEYDPVVRQILREFFECDRHALTETTDPWEVLMLLRTSLHPVIVVYSEQFLWYLFPDQQQAFANAIEELRQHHYIELPRGPTRSFPIHCPPKLQAVHDQFAPEVIPAPIQVQYLSERVQAAADTFTAPHY
jgi:CheY-like chemotaxis protein